VRRSELCGSDSYFSKILITPHLPTLSPRVFNLYPFTNNHFSSLFTTNPKQTFSLQKESNSFLHSSLHSFQHQFKQVSFLSFYSCF
jgi:hypothetical protein